jgi:probable sporulation protein (polysaccharide deacetylase family)
MKDKPDWNARSRNPLIIALTSCLVLTIAWILIGNTAIQDYINQIKQIRDGLFNGKTDAYLAATARVNFLPTDEEWMAIITAEAQKRKVPAIDAKVDRVWKAIPGYNGLEVDIPKTFQLTRYIKNENAIDFVYNETKPKVDLKDLGPNPIYRGNPRKPMVSLLINVAWGDEFLPALLKVLNKENVHATFFFDGSWLSKHLNTAQQIGAAGHELSNHAYSHKNMSQLNREKAQQEIVKTQQLLNKLGVNNTLFAPPSGDFNDETVQIAHQLHLKTILWSIDTVDWKRPTPEWVTARVTKALEPGAMILMHPTEASSLALEPIIQAIKQKGFVLGTVSELLSTARVQDAQKIHE